MKYLIKEEPEGWLVQDEDGQRMVQDLTSFIHGLLYFAGCLVVVYLGVFLWTAFSSQIQVALRIAQGWMFG